MSDAEKLLDIFRTLNVEQFRALSFARDLPSGIHSSNFYTAESPAIQYTAIMLLQERGLITPNTDKPGYYRLTHLGRRLMGLPQGNKLPGFD